MVFVHWLAYFTGNPETWAVFAGAPDQFFVFCFFISIFYLVNESYDMLYAHPPNCCLIKLL